MPAPSTAIALRASTASGLLVTRSGQERSMGGEVFSQLAGQQKAIMASGGFLCLFGFVPGFPTLIFIAVGGALLGIGRYLGKNSDAVTLALAIKKPASHKPAGPQAPMGPAPHTPEAVMPLLSVDALEIDLRGTRIGANVVATPFYKRSK